MKKLLFAAVSALVVAGGVQAGDSTEFGVLKVPSSAAQTIVAVPWLASGTGTDPVKVADLVLTTGLSVGDELKYYNGTTKQYECWVLSSGGAWTPGNSATEGGLTKVAGAEDKSLPCGEAIILKRSNPGNAFYIMGKPLTSTGSLTLPAGSVSAPVYTLIAPPKVTNTDVNSLTWTGLRAGNDRLMTKAGVTLTWLGTSSKWSGNSTTRSIPAGEGFWFISRSAAEKADAKSVTWN